MREPVIAIPDVMSPPIAVVATIAAASRIASLAPVRSQLPSFVKVGLVDREHVSRGWDALVLDHFHSNHPSFVDRFDAGDATYLFAGKFGDLLEPHLSCFR